MILRGLGILAASFILIACGGSGSSSDSNSSTLLNKESFSLNEESIKTISIVDALNRPLADADVVFTPSTPPKAFSAAMALVAIEEVGNSCTTDIAENAITGLTDSRGALTIDNLIPGTYQVRICKGEESVTITFIISSENAATSATIAAPVSVNADTGVMSVLEGDYLIVSVSGVIYSDEGVVANAQIALSGGALTNGAMATTITDENGFYSIAVNLNISKLEALESTVIQVVADGFKDLNIEAQDFSLFSAFAGINIKLVAESAVPAMLVYQENFEVLYSGKTCGEWTAEALEIEDDYSYEMVMAQSAIEVVEQVPTGPDNLWHTHTSGLNIINQAYIANLVSLAPNDMSEGKVPNPAEGSKACWYGRGYANGGIEEGNFLNEYESEGEDSGSEIMPMAAVEECIECGESGVMNGGTSSRAHSGAITSPVIDLSSETIPLALTLKTWWEIEAVNPNENGFDLMSVEYKIQGAGEDEGEWITIARLNPLTDPVMGDSENSLESIPYSNLGFNQAPFWVKQAPISLDRLAGKVIQLRFSFSTQDELYNGFRGWLIDDVQISHEVGTFPLWDNKEEQEDEEIFPEEELSEVSKALM